MKNRNFFKDVPQETWNSPEFQQELKKLDAAEYKYTKPSEIEADDNTREALNAFNKVLNKASERSLNSEPTFKENAEKIHEDYQQKLDEIFQSYVKQITQLHNTYRQKSVLNRQEVDDNQNDSSSQPNLC